MPRSCLHWCPEVTSGEHESQLRCRLRLRALPAKAQELNWFTSVYQARKGAPTMTDTLTDPTFSRLFIYDVLRKLHFLTPLYYKLLVRKWSHHSDGRRFDWDWWATNCNRVAVVNLLLSKFTNPAYLEIGCASNALFNSVPAPQQSWS
jgi:hypothetical protein